MVIKGVNPWQGKLSWQGVLCGYPTVPKRSQKEHPPVRCNKKQLSKILSKCVKNCSYSGTLGYVREHTEFERLLPCFLRAISNSVCSLIQNFSKEQLLRNNHPRYLNVDNQGCRSRTFGLGHAWCCRPEPTPASGHPA